jgi:hypothetical protein
LLVHNLSHCYPKQFCYRPMAAHWILPDNRVHHGLPTQDSQRYIWIVVGPPGGGRPRRRDLLNEAVRHPLKPSNPHVRNDLRISPHRLAVRLTVAAWDVVGAGVVAPPATCLPARSRPARAIPPRVFIDQLAARAIRPLVFLDQLAARSRTDRAITGPPVS